MKTLHADFYNRYKDTWFRKSESNKTQPMYYKIIGENNYSYEMIRYYPKTNKVYNQTTLLSIDHFSDFEIVEETDPEYKKLNSILAKYLLLI